MPFSKINLNLEDGFIASLMGLPRTGEMEFELLKSSWTEQTPFLFVRVSCVMYDVVFLSCVFL